jgi:hypothetical protein
MKKEVYQSLSHSEVLLFVKDNTELYKERLQKKISYNRVVSLAYFDFYLNKYNLKNQDHVGVVSGYIGEPELGLIKAKKVSIINFDQDKKYDLDKDWKLIKSSEYSMTICNQVLEHISNPRLAIKNLIHMTSVGGYIYISVPTINGIHGEPYFYSSGYHPRFLEKIAIEFGLKIMEIGSWGSKKYMINAVSNCWLTNKQLKPMAINYFNIKYPIYFFVDGRKNDSRIITDTWGLFQKV